MSQGHTDASSTHVDAVHETPAAHEPVPRQLAVQLVFPHDTAPAHAPVPPQQIELAVAELVTLPEPR